MRWTQLTHFDVLCGYEYICITVPHYTRPICRPVLNPLGDPKMNQRPTGIKTPCVDTENAYEDPEPTTRGNVVHNQEPAPWKTLLIGCFQDDAGKPYVMVTNLWRGAGASAAERQVTITHEFDDSIKTGARLARKTGRPELLQLTCPSLTIALPGGTGDLLGFDGLHFPSLD